MNIKVLIIENLRQIQIDMIRRSYKNSSVHSAFQGQGRVLSLLRDESSMSRSELGEKMQMSRAAMAELLGKMEKNGLIIRTPSAKDKRKIDITLTEAGKEAARLNNPDKSDLPSMLDCLDISELNQFNDYLERIIAHNASGDSDSEVTLSNEETREIIETVVDSICKACPGPEFCKHDYRKYGHDRPNPDYCKYADQFPF